MNNSGSIGFSLGLKTNKNISNNSGFSLFNDNKPKINQGFFI